MQPSFIVSDRPVQIIVYVYGKCFERGIGDNKKKITYNLDCPKIFTRKENR